MKTDNLNIEYIEIEKLSSYANNSKIHTAEQIQHIANSIKEFGFNDPLAVAGKNNVILEGNGRIEAAKLLGLTELPCVRLDHLRPDEQRAYVIAHNALNMETGFNEEVLMEELEKLQQYDFSELGVNSEKYIANLESMQKKELKPYTKVHYLISFDINLNDKIVELLEQLQKVEGVEIESSLN